MTDIAYALIDQAYRWTNRDALLLYAEDRARRFIDLRSLKVGSLKTWRETRHKTSRNRRFVDSRRERKKLIREDMRRVTRASLCLMRERQISMRVNGDYIEATNARFGVTIFVHKNDHWRVLDDFVSLRGPMYAPPVPVCEGDAS